MEENEILVAKPNTGNFVADIRTIVESAQKYAHNAVNVAMVQRNWLMGKRKTFSYGAKVPL